MIQANNNTETTKLKTLLIIGILNYGFQHVESSI